MQCGSARRKPARTARRDPPPSARATYGVGVAGEVLEGARRVHHRVAGLLRVRQHEGLAGRRDGLQDLRVGVRPRGVLCDKGFAVCDHRMRSRRTVTPGYK